MAKLDDVADYIITKCDEAGNCLNLLKLQKIVYYCQAWNLAFDRGRLFDGEFQAWVHGPVSRELYDRFNETKSLYSIVTNSDVKDDFSVERLSSEDCQIIDAVLNAYGGFSGDQLEAMTHAEKPWVDARDGLDAMARCENVISEETMKVFYSTRLKK